VVEQPAVNRLVAGSNPARGAKRFQRLERPSPKPDGIKKVAGATSGATIRRFRGAKLTPTARGARFLPRRGAAPTSFSLDRQPKPVFTANTDIRLGQHDTSSLGGIAYNFRLPSELAVEGRNVLGQSGNYRGTEDVDADAMTRFGMQILAAKPNSAERTELLIGFYRLRREVPRESRADQVAAEFLRELRGRG
jgi:hypothetical protein